MSRTSGLENESPFVKVSSWAIVAAAVSVLASLVLAGLGASTGFEEVGVSAAGYFLGSIVTAALVVVHRSLVQRAARAVWFAPRIALDRAGNALLVAGLLSGSIHALFIATELAKR